MLARVAAIEAERRAGQAELLGLACAWADAHPDEDEAREAHGPRAVSWLEMPPPDCVDEDAPDLLIPAMRWDAGAAFAAALGLSTAAGERLIRDALILRHRLPQIWRRVQAGEVESFRARKVAEAVLQQPSDISDYLDEHVAPVVHQIGPVTLARLVDEARLRIDPEGRELEQLQALDARYARLDMRGINHTGIAELVVRGEWPDVADFDRALSDVAAALAEQAEAEGAFVESLDARRSRAVGVLADPAAALALLQGKPVEPSPRRVELVVHLTPEQLAGRDPVLRTSAWGGPALDQQVRDWCGRPDAKITVKPILDLADHAVTGAYEVPDRLKEQARHLAGDHCSFPWCNRPAVRCDTDHVIPWPLGQTASLNLAPLCRRHHRLKTLAGWHNETLGLGRWRWTDPHGRTYLRDPGGTTAA
jgi:hypothetical protein